MNTIGYTVVRENLTDPLIESQCLEVIENINRNWSEGKVALIWYYRLDYLFRRGTLSLSELKNILEERGIQTIFIPFVSASFPVSWWLLPFVLPQWILGTAYVKWKYKIQILHCRSYHAGLLGCISSKFLGFKYIFDPRSPFPEENVSANRWGADSLNFKLWKKLETLIIKNSHKTILVSPFLQKNYEKSGLSRKAFSIVPNNYPSSFDSACSLKDVSCVLEREYDLVYAGSLGHWNKINPYLKLLSGLNKKSPQKFNMLFIVRNMTETNIKDLAKSYNINPDLVDVVSVSQLQVASCLSKCKLGVYLMDTIDPRLGVKTVEYLRTGLPVIVSRNIEGAAELIRKKNLGVVWDHSAEGIVEITRYINCLNPSISIECKEVAKKDFSPSGVAMELTEIYLSL